MAKHATRRSYKKRASKKRNIIRKLKRTMRRKMQRGGNGSLGLVAPVFLLFAALFANNPTVTRVLSVAQTLLGGDSQHGGNKRLNQMGGGQQFNRALDGLRVTIDNDPNLNTEERTKLIGCIDTLKSNGGISDADIQDMNKPGPEDTQIGWRFDLLNSIKDGFSAAATKAKEVRDAAATKANEMGDAAAARAKEAREAAARGVNALTDTATKTFMKNFRTQIDNVKRNIVDKVSIMNDSNKRDCMKTILSYGFDLIKAQFGNVSVQNIKDAIAVQAKDAEANSSELLSNLDSVNPSSTLMPDDGGGVIPAPIQPTDEEKKAALKAANIETVNNYNAAVKVRDDAKSTVTRNNTNGIQNQAAKNKLQEAQAATSKAYQDALEAAKAAVAGGVPESEVIVPQVLLP